MPTRRAARLAAAVVVALLALPAAARAATLDPLKACYVSVTKETREGIDVGGTGFTPGSTVDLSVDGVVQRTVLVDAAGNLPAQVLQAPHQAKGQRPLAQTSATMVVVKRTMLLADSRWRKRSSQLGGLPGPWVELAVADEGEDLESNGAGLSSAGGPTNRGTCRVFRSGNGWLFCTISS